MFSNALKRSAKTGTMKGNFPKRGGPRRSPGAHVGTDVLTKALTQAAGFVADMGTYNNIGRNCQPCGKGLLQLHVMIQLLLDCCPSFEVNPGCLLKALTNLVFAKPALNQSIYSAKVWVGQKQERITNMMYHLRRLRREEDRLQQVCMSLSSAEVNLLKGLVDQIKVSSSEGSALHEERAAQDSQSQAETVATTFYPETVVASPKRAASKTASPKMVSPRESASQQEALQKDSTSVPRKLLRKASEASQDSNGFPRMLKDMDDLVEPRRKGVKSPQNLAASSPARDDDFVALMGLQPRAQPKATGKAKAKSKAKAKAEATPKAKSKGKAKAEATTNAKAESANWQEALKTCKISTEYDQAKAAWTGSAQSWLESPERKAAVDSMSPSEVMRRRFQHLRPDLFRMGEDSKWVRN